MGERVAEMVLARPPFVDLAPGVAPPGEWDIVDLKMDGIWGQLIVRDGLTRIWSRHGQAKAEFRTPDVPDMVLHGEFMHGSNWARRRGLEGSFFAFDCVGFRGQPLDHLSLEYRRRRLSRIARLYPVPKLHMVEHHPADQWHVAWEQRVVRDGYEGLIFKRLREPFGAQWGRMKQTFTVDYICTGVNLSHAPKYVGKGMAQSLKAGLMVNGQVVTVGNIMGLTDSQRSDYWARRDELVGKVFEASGRDIFPSGALRHPNFVRWRDDKSPEECVKPKVAGADVFGGGDGCLF